MAKYERTLPAALLGWRYDNKTRSYYNPDNPSERISRRQYDRLYGRLQSYGISTPERLAQLRQQKAVPPDVRAVKRKFGYGIRAKDWETIHRVILTLGPLTKFFIEAYGKFGPVYLIPRKNTGWLSLTSYRRASDYNPRVEQEILDRSKEFFEEVYIWELRVP